MDFIIYRNILVLINWQYIINVTVMIPIFGYMTVTNLLNVAATLVNGIPVPQKTCMERKV
jgi:hypothetical protein